MSATDAGAGGASYGFIRAFLNHRVAPNLVALVLCIAGLVALTRLNTQFFPTVEIPTITIAINWPGASALDISEGILDRVEPEIRFIDGVDTITSYAVENGVRIIMEFEEGTDMDRALTDVEQRIATITGLPEDSEKPVITRVQIYETVAQIVVSGPFHENAIQDVAKGMRDELLDQGIDRVTFVGKRDQEIWAEIPPAALRQLGMTARDVAERIALVSQNVPLGSLEGGAERQLRARGRASTADGVANIELRGWETGEKVLVRDVAMVREAHEESTVRAFRKGETAILLEVQRATSADALRSMATAERVTQSLKATLPPTMRVEMFDVRAKIVDDRIRMLTENALQGFVIVLAVLLVFLNVRVALWVAMGIPVSLLATFGFMWITGQSIDAVSLVGLILVLGMIVDDAIVVGEHTVTRWQGGDSPHDAAAHGASRMFLPVMASTSTTQAAFFPMFLISGVVGQILAAIPMVVITALLASTLECFLTLPSHLKHALGDVKPVAVADTAKGRGWGIRDRFEAGFGWFRDRAVGWGVGLAYRWRYVTVGIAIASLILSFGLMAGGRVGFTFFPSPEPETIYADVTFAPGLPERQMLDGLARIEAAAHGAEAELTGVSGESLIVMVYTILGKQDRMESGNIARVEVELTPGELRTVRTDAIVDAWERAMPAVAGVDSVSVSGRRSGPPGSDIDVRLNGAPIEVLKQASLELQARLESFPGLIGIRDDLPFGKSEVLLEVNARGRALGLTTETVARQVRGAYQGAIALRFPRGDEEVTVRVRQTDRERGLAGLLDLTLRTPSGRDVLLSEVVDVREQAAFSVLQRRDGKIAVTVTADVTAGATSADAVLAALRSGALPELQAKYGFDWSFHGRAETEQEAFADLQLGTIVALALIYLILAFTFERWLQPILVMTIIPFGIVGMIVGHWVMAFDLTLFSFVGLLGLSGILVNGSIVLVDRTNERRAEGEAVEEAACGAAGDRLRALLLTTLTTVGGVAPLLFEKSLQAQFLIPIAITLCFGLAGATVLILFLMPALIGIGDDLGKVTGGFVRFLRGRRPVVG